MVQIDLLLASRGVMKLPAALETATTEPLEDLPAVDSPGLSRKALVKPAALRRLAVLVGNSGLVLEPVVDRLAETALSLTSGFPGTMDMEEIERFQRVAQQAILEPLGLVDVVVVKNEEFSFLDDTLIIRVNQSVVEEFRFPACFMGEIAGRAEYLEIRPDSIFRNGDELYALAPQALKPPKYDATHSPYV